MRLAGIDYGQSRVGVAVSDELGLMAHPRPYIDATSRSQLMASLASFAREEGIERFVVGLPRLLDGREGTAARRVRRFAEVLQTRTGVEVVLVDEWLSTKEAQARLHAGGADTKSSRSRIDSASAAILLQSYLDSRRAASAEGSDPREDA